MPWLPFLLTHYCALVTVLSNQVLPPNIVPIILFSRDDIMKINILFIILIRVCVITIEKVSLIIEKSFINTVTGLTEVKGSVITSL